MNDPWSSIEMAIQASHQLSQLVLIVWPRSYLLRK
jgi:hypothetical protein